MEIGLKFQTHPRDQINFHVAKPHYRVCRERKCLVGKKWAPFTFPKVGKKKNGVKKKNEVKANMAAITRITSFIYLPVWKWSWRGASSRDYGMGSTG